MKKPTFFLFFLIFCSGCISSMAISPIVSGAILWKNGEAIKYYDLDRDILYRAAKRNLVDMGFTLAADNLDKQGKYTLVGKSKDKIEVKILKNKRGLGEVRVRVNVMGNEPYSQLFYVKLEKQIYIIKFDNNKKPCTMDQDGQ